MIRDVLQETQRRRHVAVVLPGPIAADAAVTDGLAVEIMAQLDRTIDVVRIHEDPDADSLLQALSNAVVYDDPPVTVPDLLWHREAASKVAVIVTNDMPKAQRRQSPNLLARLERETRSEPHARRLTVITIGDRDHLPHFAGGESSDVTLATVWWWNRIARWDVAAHMAQIDPPVADHRVLADVLTETIVEIARWDLDLAQTMAQLWSGDADDIGKFLNARVLSGFTVGTAERCGTRPGDTIIDLWDDLLIDGWHDSCSASAHALTADPARLDRLIWAAQARILLPWIEERREVLYQRVINVMGRGRFQAAVLDLFDPPLEVTNVIEIGPLRRIIDIRIGDTNPHLRSAARRLHEARNQLAHLKPLGLAQLRELVAAVTRLTG